MKLQETQEEIMDEMRVLRSVQSDMREEMQKMNEQIHEIAVQQVSVAPQETQEEIMDEMRVLRSVQSDMREEMQKMNEQIHDIAVQQVSVAPSTPEPINNFSDTILERHVPYLPTSSLLL